MYVHTVKSDVLDLSDVRRTVKCDVLDLSDVRHTVKSDVLYKMCVFLPLLHVLSYYNLLCCMGCFNNSIYEILV